MCNNCPIRLGNNREILYQYDTGQTVVVSDGYEVSAIEIGRVGGLATTTAQLLPSGEYQIPDALLTSAHGIVVYAVIRRGTEESYTRQAVEFDVLPRPLPDDYVPPKDWPRWHWLDERIDALTSVVDTKTEKVELQLISGKIRRGEDELNFRQLVELLKHTPDFVYLLSGGWVYLPSFVQDTGTVQYVRFGSTIISAMVAKSSAVYIESVDGETIRGISVTTVNSENANNKAETVTEGTVGSTTLYPSIKAMVDYVAEHAPRVEVDPTLSIEGDAADAATVGGKLEGIGNDIKGINEQAVFTYAQSLTDEQKTQARSNIEAPSETAFEELEKAVTEVNRSVIGLREEVIERTTTEIAEALSVAMIAAGYKITATGGSLRDAAFKIERYRVTPGMRLRIRANNPYAPALFVFSASSTLADRIGDVYASDAETVDVTVDVPTGAVYLHVNALADESGNIVESIVSTPVNTKLAEVATALDSAVMVSQQTFTVAEKAQARRNIGAISAQEVAELVPVDATLKNAGQAADAAATGFAIVAVSESVSDVAARIGGLSFSVDADGILNVTYDEEVTNNADN